MTFGSLFAGIGGMDLGLERAGLTCKWQVEIDPYATRVLAKHWPDVRRWDDVRTFPPSGEWGVDLICGGFPCQDISFAGKGAGLAGERSGLWYEFARVVRLLRPRFVLVENVSALLARGLDSVLGTLAADGYDAEWACIPAASVGAPHIRDRVFIVGYRNEPSPYIHSATSRPRYATSEPSKRPENVAHAASTRHETPRTCEANQRTGTASRDGWQRGSKLSHSGYSLSHPDREGLAVGVCFSGNARQELAAFERACRGDGGWWAFDPADLPDTDLESQGRASEPRGERGERIAQSRMGRVANGIPARVDRLRGLGNAVVPQVAEWIGRRILETSNL